MYTITACAVSGLIGIAGCVLCGRSFSILEFGSILTIAFMGAFICRAIEKDKDK